MWATDPGWAEVLGGDHWGRFTANASYDGEDRGELEVVDCTVKRSWDGTRARTTAALTVADPDGLLVPRRLTDTLAPFGQTITLRQIIGIGTHWESSIPVGEFVVTDPGPETQWRRYRNGYLASGKVTVSLADLWERVMRNDLPGFWQAPSGATIRTEIRRLATGVVPQDLNTIPITAVPSSKSVYPESRAEAIENLLGLAGLSPMVSREGRLVAVNPTGVTAPVWTLTDDDLASFPVGVPTDQGVHNVWEVTGEQDADGRTPIRAILTERTGPLRQLGSLFGTRVFRHSAPIYTTVAAAHAATRTFRDKELATRAVEFVAEVVFRPELDLLDTIRVPLVPTNHTGLRPVTVDGLVTDIEHGAFGAMTVRFSVPWDQAGVL